MHIFLRLKHWHLFLLLIGIPIAFQLLFTFLLLSGATNIMFWLFPIIMMICVGTFMSWFFAMAVNLNKKLPDIAQMNLKKFKALWSIPTTYITLICFYIVSAFAGLSFKGEPNVAIFLIFLAIHFFSMFCIFYCLYFVAKSLKTVELQRQVTFSDYAGEFFLIWFFPIGVWFIQPRINKIFAEDNIINL